MRAKIYTVATAHLDTSWNWDFETTLREYIPKTMKDNFALFKRFPEYRFSFEGSYRYELMEEYYPAEFETLKEYAAQGKWLASGSCFENGDVNIPSPEALFRNILYGNGYFRKTLGQESADIYLPDCFGFGWALPSVAAHCGLRGFTTQKLMWSSAYGIPFDLGRWYGVDGNWIYASLDAKDYTLVLKTVRDNPAVRKKLHDNMKRYDLPFAEILHGVGDCGGAPKVDSVINTCIEERQNKYSKEDVYCASTDRIFRDMDAELTPEQQEKMPRWKNELVFTDHAVGSYTSRAQGKRFNRRCELLADAAERAGVGAMLLGAEYPQEMLDEAWKRTIAHQFHDDITGTSMNVCYKRNWNDYCLALNRFAEEYRASASHIVRAIDTSFAEGTPVVVFNPVQNQGERVGSVSAALSDWKKPFARVFDVKGNEVPSQVKRCGGKVIVTFTASVPSVGYAAYDIRPSDTVSTVNGALRATERLLENENLRVRFNSQGDICSVLDKRSGREALSAPLKLDLFAYDGSLAWPAWELNYKEVMAEPVCSAAQPKFVLEDYGQSRVSLKIVRTARGSTFTQTVSLDAGAVRVDVQNEVEWRSPRTLLKAAFPLAASNPAAAFDLGLGAIERTNDTRRLYEFPAQMWADITAEDQSFGVSVFSDSRVGWDKPNDSTLRLTCIHTPRNPYREESKMNFMDFGLNRFGFAVYPHDGSWEGSETQLQANEFNQPMTAFLTDRHNGLLGEEASLLSVSDNSVQVRCIKKAQDSDKIIVRVNEGAQKESKAVKLYFACGIEAAEETTGDERRLTDAVVEDGALVFDLQPFAVRTFAITPKKAETVVSKPAYSSVELPKNLAVSSPDECRTDGVIDGCSLSERLLPEHLVCGGVPFEIEKSGVNAVRCSGQTVAVDADADGIYLLAASAKNDKQVYFTVGKELIARNILSARENFGAWDLYALGETGYIKKETLGLMMTHVHKASGDVYGAIACFYRYFIPTKGAAQITLPDDADIILLSAAAVKGQTECRCAGALYDELDKRPFDFVYDPQEEAYSKLNRFERMLGQFRFQKEFRLNRIDFDLNLNRYRKPGERE